MQPPSRPRSRRSPSTPGSTLDDYPADGEAQIAETTLGGQRLIVRRTRLLGAQAELWPDWRHFAFVDQPHRRARARRGRAPPARRRRARDPRPQRPSAGALPLRQVHRQRRLDRDRRARAQPAALDRRDRPARHLRAARTLRRRLLTMPGRLTRTARGWTLLHLPARWPWATDFLNAPALECLRADLPPAHPRHNRWPRRRPAQHAGLGLGRTPPRTTATASTDPTPTNRAPPDCRQSARTPPNRSRLPSTPSPASDSGRWIQAKRGSARG